MRKEVTDSLRMSRKFWVEFTEETLREDQKFRFQLKSRNTKVSWVECGGNTGTACHDLQGGRVVT